jgi:hypothetical protein
VSGAAVSVNGPILSLRKEHVNGFLRHLRYSERHSNRWIAAAPSDRRVYYRRDCAADDRVSRGSGKSFAITPIKLAESLWERWPERGE